MKKWYIKELAKLAQVSVRTLHHYDQIGLLKPSLREANNYRLYSEEDLLKLQQIIALKFFGFDLSQIKEMLTGFEKISDNLAIQSKLLRKKAESLLEASSMLDRISEECSQSKSITWEKIIELIEVYKMTQQLEDAWVKDIFTPEELKEYAKFESDIKSNTTPEQKEVFEKVWFEMVDEFKQNLDKDPESETGVYLGKKLMDWVNKLYGIENAHLRTKKFEQGFAKGKGLEEHGLTPEVVDWMDKAIDAYWRQRVYDLLANVGKVSSSQLLQAWNELMVEIHGEKREESIPDIGLDLAKISPEAKEWLKDNFSAC